MKLTPKINRLTEALASIEGLDIYHYARPQKKSAPFAVWQEDGEASSLEASNKKQEQALSGSLDYFTQEEADEMVDAIQEALNEIETFGWELNSVQYEEETELIHYEWVWSIA